MSHAPTLTDLPVIGHEELRARLGDRRLHVVDVLPRDSWETGHIPGAISLPIAELPARAATTLPERGAEIAVYCAAFT